ncbi:hypothetical protein A9K66_00375 [Mesorhizobium sp. AA23]|nr:hypothetical protein A9K66_00375 [Mesorhizobium sp. AA23]
MPPWPIAISALTSPLDAPSTLPKADRATPARVNGNHVPLLWAPVPVLNHTVVIATGFPT